MDINNIAFPICFIIGIIVAILNVITIVTFKNKKFKFRGALFQLPCLLIIQFIAAQNADAHGMVGFALYVLTGITWCMVIIITLGITIWKQHKKMPLLMNIILSVNIVFSFIYMLQMFIYPNGLF